MAFRARRRKVAIERSQRAQLDLKLQLAQIQYESEKWLCWWASRCSSQHSQRDDDEQQASEECAAGGDGPVHLEGVECSPIVGKAVLCFTEGDLN